VCVYDWFALQVNMVQIRPDSQGPVYVPRIPPARPVPTARQNKKGRCQLLFYPHEKLALFVDGANLYATAKALGFDIDYKKLLQDFAKRGQLIRAYYYTALIDDREYSPVRPLVDWLDYNGYSLVTRQAKEYTDAQGRRKLKGNMDIDLAIDAMELAPYIDHMVLFSGDGDFRRLVEAVQRKGRRVSVVSTLRTQPPMVADELRRQADNFIDLSELQPLIAREGGAPRAAQSSYQPQPVSLEHD
jgi:uncharacterized LabA/DUF88 family protein